jgi:molecular chaperone HtpG
MNGEAGKLVSLKEYVSAMPEKQKDIFFLTGEDRKALEASPLLESVRKNGWDVIFMIDPIDEWVVQSLTEYDDKKLKSLAKGDVELDEESAKETEKKIKKADKEHKDLVEFLKKTLEENVKDVRFSKRLTDSACCLVGDEYDPTSNMERIFKAMNQDMPVTKRILELNADHPLVAGMQKLFDTSKEDPRLADFATLLYDQALLVEGNPIPDPMSFSKKISDLMVAAMK